MDFNFYLIMVGLLLFFAVFDLIVGVGNDAVNFLNSSIGSKVASRKTILIIASIGIILGVSFSSGMMEVARKGIFHPQFFTMPELMTLFMGVMLADVLLLDVFNTFGLPTSTTVSIVFELLGAAVAVSIFKILEAGHDLSMLGEYINTGRALVIISGILLSVIVAFIFGCLVQFFTRTVFTFDYQSRLRKFGALWGGIVVGVISLFIMIKGAKGASFITKETSQFIIENAFIIWLAVFAFSAVFFQGLIVFFKINILKPIVLFGTFALAMAFAANDLVNFIGVPLAGLHSYRTAIISASPETVLMTALTGKVQSETYLLLIAGVIMVITLWLSKKARTVSDTEINLGRQDDEGLERFESTVLSRLIVRTVISLYENITSLLPLSVREAVARRFSREAIEKQGFGEDRPSWDLVRASVNLAVASAVVSLATTMKLPLSTTYVTFMVAMGSSFADRAWGRDTAVYRVSGVITVIGGWFMTALAASTTAFIFASIIFYTSGYGSLIILAFVGFVIWRNHHLHKEKVKSSSEEDVFNLKKVNNASEAVSVSFEHTALYLQEVRLNLIETLEALFEGDLSKLKKCYKLRKRIQKWSSIIIANIFKAMRLLENQEAADHQEFPRAIRCLQSISESYRSITLRSYKHINEQHKNLLEGQVQEIRGLRGCIVEMLTELEGLLRDKNMDHKAEILACDEKFRKLAFEYNHNQLERIRSRESKTRLSILYYSLTADMQKIARQNLRLLDIAGSIYSSDLESE